MTLTLLLLGVLTVVATGGVVVIGGLFGWLNRLQLEEDWQKRARELGLRSKGGVMWGREDGFELAIRKLSGDQGGGVQLEVHGVPDKLEVTAQTWASRTGLLGEDIQTGDAPFDAKFQVWGRRDVALASLSDAARQQLHELEAVDPSVCVRKCVVVGRLASRHPGAMRERLRRLQDLAAELRGPEAFREQPRGRMLEHVQGDGNEAVRLKNLRYLLDHGGSHGRRAARLAVRSRNARARLVGAMHLEDVDVLLELAKRGRASVRADALKGVVQLKARSSEVLRVVDRCLRDEDAQVRAHAVRAAGKLRHKAALPVIERMAEDQRGKTKARRWRFLLQQIARALGRLGKAEVEDALLGVLEREGSDAPVAVAVCEALGKVGTVRAVEKLLPLKEGMLTNADQKRAAANAIAAIQGRAKGAVSGMLSVAAVAEEAGQLAIAGHEGRGDLAVVESSTKS